MLFTISNILIITFVCFSALRGASCYHFRYTTSKHFRFCFRYVVRFHEISTRNQIRVFCSHQIRKKKVSDVAFGANLSPSSCHALCLLAPICQTLHSVCVQAVHMSYVGGLNEILLQCVVAFSRIFSLSLD